MKVYLDESIYIKANKVIVDSRSQCSAVGDVSCALKNGIIELGELAELGEVLINPSLGRTSDDQITICNLTGIAIQDLIIAESVIQHINKTQLTQNK